MKLKDIADLFMIKETQGDMDIEITGLQMDSRKVEKGNLFICVPAIKGYLEDRHFFAQDAVVNGAVALVVEREVDIDVPKIFVKDARQAMAVISSHFYNDPSNEMKLIGITGTNGKTTTSHIIEKIFDDYGLNTGLMGNNGIKIGGKMYPTDLNTQEPPILQRNLRNMRENNTEYCVMEVSSQGLDMKRVMGCNFSTAVFTNLTQDHLDYHGSFEEYRNTKGLLFSRLGNSFNSKDRKYTVLNADDPSFEYFRKVTSAEVITYGINNKCDVSAQNITMTSKGIRFLLSSFKGEIEIDLKLLGWFNVYNALASISVALIEGIPLQRIKSSLSQLTSINGRMEIVDEGQDFLVVVDYAHTPDALENVLKTIKEFTKGKVITVFGCGGDRDKGKRPIMGEIASRHSNVVFVTSDNPRSEDPIKIMNDIEKGMIKSNSVPYELVVNRDEAIYKAINLATSNDVVIIAGKGHETYQSFKDKTIHFDDKEIARTAISKKEY
ncbi:UDP-N-acetylmuramoyl-L-alanyl-D-glutamate--2,6-diaminopimelate ligase [Bacillus mesophilus]|uniref:UDP-N-acetylmuramoyl-L-alanyl-D-glutamate--2,6-diaminopimelate ligase n=1 Tax=Bacillus mesophilus TaxID=1808955 RepID=A0A6M0Q557_9BACI|nr:UDP-N-acetylmuramoyl-L-alanyl-D-glutamate--2,6-diaminopimelate ligase [Bacillus mesophilus]MBM7661094.1 UDP-N-acetylmuramoyl-L-alanyl-D-glutamate--2,6-diaminopimelate ligase [Bacillus mesophilus]NEY71373.1 UDP-N-acetylmuramoyl-L-alanyl-D-glutamate--2,6-diaminopimelate ligase [Bacillus mesophilus]